MENKLIPFLAMSMILGVIFCGTTPAQNKPKIAVFAGSNATVQNSVPLVSSNKEIGRAHV